MGAMQRRKGRAGEQELVRLLSENLGEDIARNLGQSRDGGADVIGVGRFALEIKRQETLSLGTWWRQACEQAERAELWPALAYRKSRMPWNFVVPLAVLLGGRGPMDAAVTTTMGLHGFCLVVQETRIG